MGRIDLASLAADGRVIALEANWLLLVAITAAAVVAYVVASCRASRMSGAGGVGR